MPLIVHPDGVIDWRGRLLRCALGRSGIAVDKREGDGATPAGRFPLRRVLYRADRVPAPRSTLPASPIAETDGWCDDPADARYNRQVTLPWPGRHETLWREDGLYDLVVVVGHNDDPPVPHRGSAIFIHVARPGYAPTEGCVALALDDLREIVEELAPDDEIRIVAPAP
ncbi:MAG: L,D-transpeptidase family protein [Alphaproteobacteria bacterium]|nr:L,D-transpeptidase family protein [Alphaproteobacteria bacterium]